MSTTVSSEDNSIGRQPPATEAERAIKGLSERLSERAAAGKSGFWGPAAPKQIGKIPEDDWNRWQRHLRKRKSPQPLEPFALPDNRSSTGKRSSAGNKARPGQGLSAMPLAWAISRFSCSTADLLALLDALDRQRQEKGESASKKSSRVPGLQVLEETLTHWLELHDGQLHDGLTGNNGPSHQKGSWPTGQVSNDNRPDKDWPNSEWPNREWSDDWPDTQDALACLAVAHALPSLAEIIPAELWWQLLDALWRIVESSADCQADCQLPLDQSLAGQLLAGELPLTLAYLFPEIRPLARLRETARDCLSAGLLELLNGEGLPKGCQLPILRPLLACWTRCLLIGQAMKRRSWNRKAQNQYLWLIRQALRCSASDGRSLLSARSCWDRTRRSTSTPLENEHNMAITSEKWSPDFLRTVLSLGDDCSDLAAARGLFDKKLVTQLDKSTKATPPETSDHCQWSGLAVMRTAWSCKAPVVAVDFSSPDMKIEIFTGGDSLAAGIWSSSSTFDGKRLEQVGQWEKVCWFSDQDVDCLELSIEMTGGARLVRKIVLAREDLFLLLTDSILTTGKKNSSSRKEQQGRTGQLSPKGQLGQKGQRGHKGLTHTSRLPLDTSIQWIPAEETREGLLTAGSSLKPQPLARVFPLALPEWRIDCQLGELTCETGSDQQSLQWTCQTSGQDLTSPLFLDLNRRRATRRCTWRQLTVAQALEIQPAEVAAGYRVQCGKKQWVIYQSLAPRANRTLLGHNLSSEYLVGRFLAASGEVDELLEIED
jgi:hypothetical protein